MGLLRTILILLAIYFLFRFIMRVILPLLLKNYIEKKQKEFFGQHQQQHFDKKEEGKITVKKTPSSKGKKSHDDDEGEYVDYEEIKD
jgi:hypothetical protein